MATVTNTTLNKILEILNDEIEYIGLGTGSAPNINDELLDGETERKLATKLIDENTLIAEAFWDTNEGNDITYTNVAAFGDGATVDLDTGKIFVGGPLNITKLATETLTVSFEITVEAVN